MRKSILAPSQSLTYLGVCLDSVEMRARLSRERAVAILSSLRHFREGSSVHLKEFQRLLGLMVSASAVCHLGLLHMRPLQLWLKSRVPWTMWTSGRLSIAVTAPRQEPDVRRKAWGPGRKRHGQQRSLQHDSRSLPAAKPPSWWSEYLHRSSGAVAQHRSLQPGSPPGLGSFTSGGHKGRTDVQLGSSVRGNASFGTVVGTSEPVAHKPLGIGSSLLSFKGVSDATGTAACTDSHRQYVRGFVHKSPGRHSLQGFVQASNESTDMGELSPSLHQSNAHPRSPEPRGGHAFEKEDPSRGVGVAPRVGSDDLELLQESEGGSIRHEWECALPIVLLLVSLPAGRGRTHIALASSLYAFPPIKILPLVPPNQPWFPDLTELLVAPPWPIPVRKDMLSQADGSVWHSNPELWSLHVWLLQGYQRSGVPCSLACSTH